MTARFTATATLALLMPGVTPVACRPVRCCCPQHDRAA